MKLKKHLIYILILISVAVCFAENEQPHGTIKGNITDVDTKLPLPAANIILTGTQHGASTDLNGNFTIYNVPVGSYTAQCSYIGYEPIIITDVVVKSNRVTMLQTELKSSAINADVVTVKPSYFVKTEKQPVSVVSVTNEEIRRASGSAGDVSRIMMALPSVAKVNDVRNSLVVRGGSPMENGYFVDNIAIPNINHFPTQGASGGAVGLLNVDFIKNVRFYSGGFAAVYGDKLSSIMDLSFREGNPSEFDAQLDLNMQGFGAVAEGPLWDKHGSWMFSARRSYWDLIINEFDIEASAIPEIADFQGKVVYNLSNKHKMSFLDILGFEESIIEKERSLENRENVYGNWKSVSNTAGANWRYLWGGKGYSNTSISFNYTKWNSKAYETRTDYKLTENESTEQKIWLRNINHYNLNPNAVLDFGVEVKLIDMQYDNFYAAYTDPLGNLTPELRVDDKITSVKYGAFVSYHHSLFNRLIATPGIRLDYFEYNDNVHISPRITLSYQLRQNTFLNCSYGKFYQFLPMIMLSQNESFKELNDPVADHFVLGVSHLLSEDTRLTVEAYSKEYRNMPLDPGQGSLFIIDGSNEVYGFSNYEQLVDEGEAYARGVEIMLQKKLAKNIYGVTSGSYFRTRYKDYDGVWRDRSYDNQYMFTINGGYKPNNHWEFGMRWVYAGGTPYTPFDIKASEAAHRAVLNSTKINEERLPDYHTLDVRVDRRSISELRI